MRKSIAYKIRQLLELNRSVARYIDIYRDVAENETRGRLVSNDESGADK